MLGVREADIELRHCEDEVLLDPSLALYLPLHRLDGASFMSKDHYGHLCTNYGSKWQLDGRYFDGVDDYVDCGNAPSLPTGAIDFSVEAWVKTSDSAGGVVMKHSGGTVGEWLYCLADGKLRFGGTQSGKFRDTIATVNDNKWHHMVGIVEHIATGNNNLYEYIDAELDGSLLGFADIESGTRNVLLGDEGNHSYQLSGLIGEVRIYNRALHPLRIQHNYLATKWRYQ